MKVLEKFTQKITQNLRYKCLYVRGFWKPKQYYVIPVCQRFLKAKTVLVIVCKYLFSVRIKSDYVAIFVTWPQSLNCLFHVRIAILDMGRAGGRVDRKEIWSFLSRKHSHKCFRKVFRSVSVPFSKLYWRKIKNWMRNFQDLLFMLKRSFCDIICLNVP